ncbi:DUF1007 family protein [Devosia sp. A8/3-2]|nr:DUF1007 family protein [Devosia sp. A8/3-2]
MTVSNLARLLAVVLAGLLALMTPARAHPHIFIDAKVSVQFDDSGAVVGLKHNWTFDEAFSSRVIQGSIPMATGSPAPKNCRGWRMKMSPGWANSNSTPLPARRISLLKFQALGDQHMVYENGRVTLSYSLKTERPHPVGQRFELGVYDPDYYVAITFADKSDVTLENAPGSCAVTLDPPKDMDPDVQSRLYALGPDVTELPPDLAAAMRGTQGMIVITCGDAPAAAPSTALDAINDSAVAKPSIPFGGPPPEPGLNLPRTGFFGWLQEQQRNFYGAMNAALGAAHRLDGVLAAGRAELSLWRVPRGRAGAWQGGHLLLCAGQ